MAKLRSFIAEHDYSCWCGQSNARLVAQQMFGRRHFAVLECANCKTQRILPRALMNEAAAEELYNDINLGQYHCDLEVVGRKMFPRFKEVGISFSPQTQVLDVGCGGGGLLNAICKTFGSSGLGIDVDKHGIAAARAQASAARFECELFDPQKLRGQFDVIISNAVLEHVIDPVKLLRGMSEALRPQGRLFVLTPNGASLSYRVLRSWWRELLSIGYHIYLFTPASLDLCAREAGLRTIAISSGFDFAAPQVSFNGFRDLMISGWWCYREAVKRATNLVATSQNRDILYASLANLSQS